MKVAIVMVDPRLLIASGVFGAVIGSFLNVCIHRVPRSESVVFPPSRCPGCGHQLAWFENIPVASYIALGARCRQCRAPISIRYPIIEALTSAMFVLALWHYGPGWLVVQRLVLGCILIVLFAIDLEVHLLPNSITIPGIVAGFAFSFVTEPGWLSSLIGIAVGGGLLIAIYAAYYRIRGEEGLGIGDIKMLAMIGAFLGWKLTLFTLIIGSFSGSFVGLFFILTQRGDMKYALPFGTFLAFGAAVAATVGSGVVNWYLGML